MCASYQEWLCNVCNILENIEKHVVSVSWGAINSPDFIKGRNDDRYVDQRRFIVELAKVEESLENAIDLFFKIAKDNDVLAIRHKSRR